MRYQSMGERPQAHLPRPFAFPVAFPLPWSKSASALRALPGLLLRLGRRLALGEPVGPVRPDQRAGGDAIGHLGAQTGAGGDGGGGKAGQVPHVVGEPGALPVGVLMPPPAAHAAPSTG
jgi:hypothetical protein